MSPNIEEAMENPIDAAIITQLYHLAKEAKSNSPYGKPCSRYSVSTISEGIRNYADNEIRERLIKMENDSIVIGPAPFSGTNNKFGLSQDAINFMEDSKDVIKL